MRRVHRTDDRGFTLVELMISSMLLLTVLGLVGGFVSSGVRTGRFAEQETASLDSARVAQGQILKDLRSAVAADTAANSACTSNGAPAGYCLLLYFQSPTSGTTDQIRYRAVQTGGSTGPTSLYRDTGCDPTFTCTDSRDLVDNLNNRSVGSAMFVCDVSSTYPEINVTMVVSPLATGVNPGTLTIQTKGRPRNIAGNSC
jgi:prepilin-type N-terminal cleavage/methylation domain-containing protein